MTRIALITTTINVPMVLTQWVKSGMTEDDIIIVAGDLKSPHSEIETLLNDISMNHGVPGEYLDHREQRERYPRLSDIIGWNCIQRRNIALLEAMRRRPRYILTIDDDNAPNHERQVSRLIEIIEAQDPTPAVISTNTGWYDPGRQCLTNELRTVSHRGYPQSQRHVKPFMTYEHAMPPIGVAAMLWTGDPDIDAIERMVNAPLVTRVDFSAILQPGTWAPFNTQATMFRGELAPFMLMWPHVGRYDDIWASYVTRVAMDRRGMGAYYGRPAVHQDRNEHNLLGDLDAELFGMRHNEELIAVLRSINWADEKHSVSWSAIWDHIFDNVVQRFSALPIRTAGAMDAWRNDVQQILGEW